MQYLPTIFILAATLTHGVAVSFLRAHNEITPQASENYLLKKTYTDAACLHVASVSTTQADLCLRNNLGKYVKITSVASNATTTSYTDSSCTTVEKTVTERLISSCTLGQSGLYSMSSFSVAPAFASLHQGVTIR